jgi:hypothetical protein
MIRLSLPQGQPWVSQDLGKFCTAEVFLSGDSRTVAGVRDVEVEVEVCQPVRAKAGAAGDIGNSLARRHG